MLSFGCNRPILSTEFDIDERINLSLRNGFTIPLFFFLTHILQELSSSTFFSIKIPYVNSLFSKMHDILEIPWIHDFSKQLIVLLFERLKISSKDLFFFSDLREKHHFLPKIFVKVVLSRPIT